MAEGEQTVGELVADVLVDFDVLQQAIASRLKAYSKPTGPYVVKLSDQEVDETYADIRRKIDQLRAMRG